MYCTGDAFPPDCITGSVPTSPVLVQPWYLALVCLGTVEDTQLCIMNATFMCMGSYNNLGSFEAVQGYITIAALNACVHVCVEWKRLTFLDVLDFVCSENIPE